MSARLALLLGLLALLPASASANFDCVASYEAGRYREAAACFDALERTGHHNGHLLYNEGNAWYRAGDVGRAVLAYRRAQLHLPRHGDVRANLQSARELAKDDLAPPERGPLARAVLAPYDALSLRELLLLGTVAWLAFFLLATVQVAGRAAIPPPLLAALAVAVVLGLGGAASRALALSGSPDAVVLVSEVTLRSGRDVQSVDLARLHAGAEVELVERDESWAQIRLSSGQRGWLPRSAVGLVQLEPAEPTPTVP